MNILEVEKNIQEKLNISQKEVEVILNKALLGKEVLDNNIQDLYQNRFLPNLVFIDENGYAKMCIDALKITITKFSTDYSSRRQRDFGQLWGDMTRGYLAEYAFILFLKEKWGISAELGHEKGNLEDYLPSDIYKIKKEDDDLMREPNLKIGIKGTKWNGIWFDIPGNQFSHSDIHVFVKVGTARDHLFAYFKHISVFKDKILKKGIEIGSINQAEADSLYNKLPLFQPIPAYISGFAITKKNYLELPYKGKKGKKHFTINEWSGEIKSGDLEKIKIKENLEAKGNVKFEGIGEFSHDKGFLFNTGSLYWKKEDWENNVISKL